MILLFYNLLKAVQFLHSRNIIHGDINLCSILVTPTLQVQFFDFGYSTLLENSSNLISSYSGSILYLSPEIVLKMPYNGECK